MMTLERVLRNDRAFDKPKKEKRRIVDVFLCVEGEEPNLGFWVQGGFEGATVAGGAEDLFEARKAAAWMIKDVTEMKGDPVDEIRITLIRK